MVVHQLPLLPPPPPPPPPHSTRAKRPSSGLPPGFAGVRQPPQKSPCQSAPAQQQHVPPQPAPDAHRAPGTSSLPPPAHAISQGAIMPAATTSAANPALQRRSAPRKKPTVPCGLCGVLCMTARHLKQHGQGRRHRNKAAHLAGEMNVRCPVCDVHLSSGLNVEQHLPGKQHARRLMLKEVGAEMHGHPSMAEHAYGLKYLIHAAAALLLYI
ncbi:hypothetical protein C2845_PM01G39120 [Panicum miliaceum]|uniref:C2H2-type domain-containing protein n=1 Tax=Panicum miliaceum TaxID=4540 RepID=A0A3L6TQ20_PANMI|nr:hypothetical protein C2845_PM01G39120 [Panicum miliaceum]